MLLLPAARQSDHARYGADEIAVVDPLFLQEFEDYNPSEETNLLYEGIDRYFGIRSDKGIESPIG